ncbi:MAG: hypothetical protein WAN03_09105 [Candidatus Sulfotelmatobacter sp.]
MEPSNTNSYQLECPLAHDLINKLTAIVGHCDLLVERVPESSPLFARMLLVRDMAKSVGEELGQFQCELVRLRVAPEQKEPVV